MPLLAGWNHDEGGFKAVLGQSPAETLKAAAVKEFGEKADEFLHFYPENDPANDYAQARRSSKDFAGDRFIAWSTWRWLEAQATTANKPSIAIASISDRRPTQAPPTAGLTTRLRSNMFSECSIQKLESPGGPRTGRLAI